MARQTTLAFGQSPLPSPAASTLSSDNAGTRGQTKPRHPFFAPRRSKTPAIQGEGSPASSSSQGQTATTESEPSIPIKKSAHCRKALVDAAWPSRESVHVQPESHAPVPPHGDISTGGMTCSRPSKIRRVEKGKGRAVESDGKPDPLLCEIVEHSFPRLPSDTPTVGPSTTLRSRPVRRLLSLEELAAKIDKDVTMPPGPRPFAISRALEAAMSSKAASSRQPCRTFSDANEMWTEKWKPRRADEVLDNEDKARYLRDWLRELEIKPAQVVDASSQRQDFVTGSSKDGNRTHSSKGRKRQVVTKVEKKQRKKARRKAGSSRNVWMGASSDEDDGLADFIVPDDWYEEDLRDGGSDAAVEGTAFDGDSANFFRSGSATSSPRNSSLSADVPPLSSSTFSPLTNTILLCGPFGSGKTAAVYACAAELGYEVFELFPGVGKRSGKELSGAVGDMTKNHIVGAGGLGSGASFGRSRKAPAKPLAKPLTLSKAAAVRNGTDPALVPPPGDVSRDNVIDGLVNLQGEQKNKRDDGTQILEQRGPDKTKKAAIDVFAKLMGARKNRATKPDLAGGDSRGVETPPESAELMSTNGNATDTDGDSSGQPHSHDGAPSLPRVTDERNANGSRHQSTTMTASPISTPVRQSLILLEEVDVLFEEDKGFWQAVVALIAESKRPVILTCNDLSLVPVEDLPLQTTLFFVPPLPQVAVPYLQLVALAEGHILSEQAVALLYEATAFERPTATNPTSHPNASAPHPALFQRELSFDLRRALCQLQFWCQWAVGSEKAGLDWLHVGSSSAESTDDKPLFVWSDGTYNGWEDVGRPKEQVGNLLNTQFSAVVEAVESMESHGGSRERHLGFWEAALNDRVGTGGERLATGDGSSALRQLRSLQSFTDAVSHSDAYLRRSFSGALEDLEPDIYGPSPNDEVVSTPCYALYKLFKPKPALEANMLASFGKEDEVYLSTLLEAIRTLRNTFPGAEGAFVNEAGRDLDDLDYSRRVELLDHSHLTSVFLESLRPAVWSRPPRMEAFTEHAPFVRRLVIADDAQEARHRIAQEQARYVFALGDADTMLGRGRRQTRNSTWGSNRWAIDRHLHALDEEALEAVRKTCFPGED